MERATLEEPKDCRQDEQTSQPLQVDGERASTWGIASVTPSTFQRLMNKVFVKKINSFILVYLDDILVHSRSIEEHWDHLQRVLERLR